jgi:hypothetical protein
VSDKKPGATPDTAEQDAQRDLESLRRQDAARWRAVAERKYPRFRSTPNKARTTNPSSKGQNNDER